MSVNSGARRILIRPSCRSGWRQWAELPYYRELLWTLIQRDIKVRYKQTVFGCAWAVLQPLVSMAIFSVIFGHFMKTPSQGAPYPLFSYAGLIAWSFFANAVSTASMSLVVSSGLVTKVYFPRVLIPVSSAGVFVVDLCVATAIFLPALVLTGHTPGPAALLLLPATIGLFVFSVSVGAGLAALTVRFRDVRYAIPFVLQVLLYTTPVVYAPDIVPQEIRHLLYLNPVCGFVEVYRAALLGTAVFSPGLALSALSGLLLAGWGLSYFSKVERSFADML